MGKKNDGSSTWRLKVENLHHIHLEDLIHGLLTKPQLPLVKLNKQLDSRRDSTQEEHESFKVVKLNEMNYEEHSLSKNTQILIILQCHFYGENQCSAMSIIKKNY